MDTTPPAPQSTAAVQAEALQLGHGRHVVFGPSDLAIAAGTSAALIGPNGSGKSTLLDAIAGLRPPMGGTIAVFGGPPVQQRRRIAYVVQSSAVSEQLPISVREVVAMGRFALRGAFRRLRPEDHRAVDEAMERLDVARLARRRLHEVSGGERQRTFVAQGLVQEADLLLLDEPVTGLDVVSRQVILDVVRTEVARGTTVVFSTHDLGDARLVDQLLLLAGRVVASGPPGAVLTGDHLARAFGGRVIRLDGDRVLLDDDPHPFGHDDPSAHGHSHSH